MTRKDLLPIKVHCLSEEKVQLQAKAEAAGLSLSVYSRRVRMGYKIQGILNDHRVQDLAKINGDQGCLGDLLKLWLMDDRRTAEFSTATLQVLSVEIEITQDELQEVIKKVMLK